MGKITFLVNGAAGKMGRIITAGLMQQEDLQLVGAVDIKCVGQDVGALCGTEAVRIFVEDHLATALQKIKPQVMVDFTNPQAVMKNIRMALEQKVAVVVGTTGLGESELAEIEKLANIWQRPVFVAPNFALGAVLMMQFAATAAQYMPYVEIIEKHHDQKLDAPSGTALATLDKISQARAIFTQGAPNEFEKINGSRGGDYQGMRVHSVRLPGFVASQDVIFGDVGQTLTISHNSISRDSFVPGVVLAVRKILALKGLTYGLEKIMS